MFRITNGTIEMASSQPHQTLDELKIHQLNKRRGGGSSQIIANPTYGNHAVLSFAY